jgi:hypothetical protein
MVSRGGVAGYVDQAARQIASGLQLRRARRFVAYIPDDVDAGGPHQRRIDDLVQQSRVIAALRAHDHVSWLRRANGGAAVSREAGPCRQ